MIKFNNLLKLTLFVVFIFISSSTVINAQCVYRNCVINPGGCHPSLCTITSSSCSWQPCTCNTSFAYNVNWCGRNDLVTTECETTRVCEWVTRTTCVRSCDPIPVKNSSQVQAQVQALCPLVCGTFLVQECHNERDCWDVVTPGAGACVPKTTPTTQFCSPTTVNNPSPTPTNCPAEVACTPTCASGTVNYNTGYPAPSASCSYRTGGVNSNGTCEQSTVNTNCWYPIPSTPPNVTITVPGTTPEGTSNTTTALGCVAPAGYVGMESNNITTYDFEFDDADAANLNEALMVYFSEVDTNTLSSSMSKVYDTGVGKMILNSRFGFMVRKEASGWNSIYIPRANGSVQDWVKAGTIGSGLRAEILGINSKKMVGIRDVSVTSTTGKNNLRFSLEFYNETSGLADYEKVTDNSYAIYGAANRRSTFLPLGGDTMVSVPQWLNSGKDIVIDLNNPVADSLAVVFGSNTRINLTWRYSDSFSPIIRSIGDATRPTAGKINENIDDITSGVSNYVFGSGATGANLFSGMPHLWVANNLATRTDNIDLNNNEGGTIQFQSWGFDRVCNSASTTSSVPMGSAWMTTRGGVVYSSGGVNFEIFPLTGHSGFSADAYWAAPFAFYKDEADVTTELVSASTSAINALLYPTKGTTRSLNHFDVNNRVGYWFDSLKQKSLEQIAGNPSKYVTLNYSSNLTTSSTSSALNDGTTTCDVNKHCIVNVAGNLGLNSGFVCDAKTTFLVAGTTNIEPDITASGFAQGCIIVSKGDITISDGTYKSGSSTYPKYDIVEAFMISDGKINIPLVDSASDVRDGLLVHGSILGFSTVDGLSINLARSLKPIFNQSYPTVAVHFDNRYLNIATEAFGGDVEGYRREVGFKPY